VSLPVLVRRPVDLLAPLGGAALMLLVLGPGVRGAAAAVLAAAAAVALRIRAPSGAEPSARPVQVLQRLELAPRVTIALVETCGRRYLVTAGASVTPLPLEESP